MARTKKTESITDEELYDVLEFAKNMYSGAYQNNIFTPELVNSRLKDVSLNPLAGTKEEIEKALANPKNSEKQLVGYSEYFELVDMLYKRQLYYLGNLLSWDYTYTCVNISKDEEYNSLAFKKDEKSVIDFLDKFKVKQEFQRIFRQLIRQEIYYGVLRQDSDEQYTVQELNKDYCRTTGRWERGLLFDFNMQYFLGVAGVDINMFPDVFKKYYKRVMDNKNNGYNPSKNIDIRNGEWVLWVQTSPDDGMWAFKMTPEIIANVPIFSPLFTDLSMRPLVRNLQQNKYIIEASKVLIGLVGFNKDAKSGSVRDALNMSPETIGKFANLIRQGLTKEIQFGVAPFSDVLNFEWKSDGNNILDEYNKVTIGQGGTNTRLLYATDKMNAVESRNSLAIDEQLVEFIYPYFENFIEYYANKRTKKYKFKFKFEGTNMPDNKQSRLDNAMTLAQSGIVLPQKIAAAMGMEYHDFERQLAMGRSKKFTEMLTPLLTSYTMSGKDMQGGRPQKKDDDLSDDGMKTRDTGGNINRGGEV